MLRIVVTAECFLLYVEHLQSEPFVYDDIRSLVEDLWWILESEVSIREKVKNEEI